MLPVAKGPSAALGGVVGGLPRWVVQEHAQSREVVGIEVLLLSSERHQLGSRGVIVPGVVALLGVSRSTAVPIVILPDGEPRLQEGASHPECCSDGAS